MPWSKLLWEGRSGGNADGRLAWSSDHGLDDLPALRVGDSDDVALAAVVQGLAAGAEQHLGRLQRDHDNLALAHHDRPLNVGRADRHARAKSSFRREPHEIFGGEKAVLLQRLPAHRDPPDIVGREHLSRRDPAGQDGNLHHLVKLAGDTDSLLGRAVCGDRDHGIKMAAARVKSDILDVQVGLDVGRQMKAKHPVAQLDLGLAGINAPVSQSAQNLLLDVLPADHGAFPFDRDLVMDSAGAPVKPVAMGHAMKPARVEYRPPTRSGRVRHGCFGLRDADVEKQVAESDEVRTDDHGVALQNGLLGHLRGGNREG